eukprot:6528844-Prymnesium_polylepis.1
MDAATAAAGAVVPAAAVAVAAPANPVTMAAVAVRQRLDVQAVHASRRREVEQPGEMSVGAARSSSR